MRILPLFLTLALFSTVSFAQDRVTGGGTVEILELQFFPRMTRGKLDACELTYLLAFEDYVYRKGAVSALRGALVFTGFIDSPDKGPAVLFKATAFDFINNQPVIAPLEYAYLSASGASYAGEEYTLGQAEDGGLLVGYDALRNPMLSTQIFDNIQLNITRLNGRSDIAIPLDILANAPEKVLKLSNCSIELLNNLQTKFGN